MNIHNIDEHLYDVRLNQFLSVWVYKDEDLCFITDPGPTYTIPILIKALKEIGIKHSDLDYILLTHIHMDHAGGVGTLVNDYTQATIICHPRGIKHLINPEKLWEGSKKVLGNAVEMFGKMIPVPANRVKNEEYLANNRIQTIETLGHAPHHQSYLFGSFLFVGEAAGFHRSIGNDFYLRPATPPVFNYDIWRKSTEKLLSLNLSGYKICYPHYGMRDNAELMIKNAAEQLSVWVEVLKLHVDELINKKFNDKLITELKDRDRFFKKFDLLEEFYKNGELNSVRNCINGILGYLKTEQTKY